MTSKGTSPSVEPLLDLRGLVAGVLWRRRLWGSAALIGVLLGAVATLLIPPTPTAVTRVLVAREGEVATPETVMATDVALFNTTATAAAASKKLGLDERPQDFRETFDGSPVTGSVLQITAEGPSDAEAVHRARVLAELFISGHVERARGQAQAKAQALMDQRAQLQRQLTGSNDGTSATLGDEFGASSQSRAAIESEMAELERRARDALLKAAPVAAGTQIVDPPRALPKSILVSGVVNIVVGSVFGLAAGLALAAVLCVTRDRPVLRRDIAAHLGVSVIVQLPAVSRSRLWKRGRPGTRGQRGNRGRRARERRRAAGTLARVVGDAPGPVALLEVGCPETTAALALAIADELATDRPVTLVDHLDGAQLGQARGQAGEGVEIVDITDLPSHPHSQSGSRWGSQYQSGSRSKSGTRSKRRKHHLGVGSVGPGSSWADLDRLGYEALLAVRAGQASTLWLHTVARRLAHAGISPIGVVLIQPYPWDGTDGTLWDELHAVLRQHDRTEALPHAPGDEPPPDHRNGSIPARPDSPTQEMRLP